MSLKKNERGLVSNLICAFSLLPCLLLIKQLKSTNGKIIEPCAAKLNQSYSQKVFGIKFWNFKLIFLPEQK